MQSIFIPLGLTLDVAPSESKSVTSSFTFFKATLSFESGLVKSISSNLLKSIVEKFAKTVSVKLLFQIRNKFLIIFFLINICF